ncbi:hypothetical protein KFE25_003251 [Diacronema lutheri]|uniref:Uncharacterized protein n=2 Tax=Diacronema lutheri TaxID=2081491 RepID=A0A8J5XHE7_DIALT|nr:hypothetical protein KFE25_003251 [Diacronema lutheri]
MRRASTRKASLVDTRLSAAELAQLLPNYHPTGNLSDKQMAILTKLRAGTCDYAHLDLAFSRSLGPSIGRRRHAPEARRARPESAGPGNLAPNTFGGVQPRFPQPGFAAQIGVPLHAERAYDAVRPRAPAASFGRVARPRSAAPNRPTSALPTRSLSFAGRAVAGGRVPITRSSFGIADRFASAPGADGSEGTAAARFTLSPDLMPRRWHAGIGGGPAFTFAKAAAHGQPQSAEEIEMAVDPGVPGPGAYRPRHPLDLASTRRFLIGERYKREPPVSTVTPGPVTATWSTIPPSSAPAARMVGKWSRSTAW